MELPIRSPEYGRNRASYSIETKNLSYRFPGSCHKPNWMFCREKSEDKFILRDVNCEARPGEITAIAGPSGAGKTTLLEILAGFISCKRVSGHVLVNGCPMNAQRFRKLSGYVTQEDALFPLLTVEETLLYSALLRLPGEKKRAIDRVKVLIKELGLDSISNSKIGEGSNSGISGGEKRRVSIGVELVHDPAVIFVDEPTSGLDSASALQVILLLKKMAVEQGKTILLTIHQPGFRILEMLDRLVLISNGVVVHNSSIQNLEERLKSSGYGIPYRVNVLEFAIEVAGSSFMHSPEKATGISGNQIIPLDQSVAGGYDSFMNISILNGDVEKSPSYSNSCFKETLILGERFSKNTLRTKELFRTRIIQALVAGFTLGTIFINNGNAQGDLALQTRLGFFAFTLTFLLSSSTEGLPIFLQERRIFMRETSTGAYRVSSYVLANTIVFLPFLLMVAFLYTAPVYWLVGLRRTADGYFYFTLVVWMVVLMSNSFTACFSVLVPNYIMGISIISGLMGSFFLFSGYFITEKNIPSYWIFMHYLSLFKYPFECFLINEYGGKGGNRCLEGKGGGGGEECKLYGNQFLRQQGIEETQKWTNLLVMLAFIISYRLFCFLILWYKCYRCRS